MAVVLTAEGIPARAECTISLAPSLTCQWSKKCSARRFACYDALKQHVKLHCKNAGKNGRFTCYCYSTYSSSRELITHALLHLLPSFTLPCPFRVCGKFTFSSTAQLQLHFATTHLPADAISQRTLGLEVPASALFECWPASRLHPPTSLRVPPPPRPQTIIHRSQTSAASPAPLSTLPIPISIPCFGPFKRVTDTSDFSQPSTPPPRYPRRIRNHSSLLVSSHSRGLLSPTKPAKSSQARYLSPGSLPSTPPDELKKPKLIEDLEMVPWERMSLPDQEAAWKRLSIFQEMKVLMPAPNNTLTNQSQQAGSGARIVIHNDISQPPGVATGLQGDQPPKPPKSIHHDVFMLKIQKLIEDGVLAEEY